MFKIDSYINYPGRIIRDLEDLKKRRSFYLIDIENLEELDKIKKKIDIDYIDGAIEIQYKGEILLNITSWDLVDQLWDYILNIIEDMLKFKKGSTGFPDHPADITIEDISPDKILFSIKTLEKKSWCLPKKKFLNALLDGGEHFFFQMMIILPSEQSKFMRSLNRIKKIRSQIN